MNVIHLQACTNITYNKVVGADRRVECAGMETWGLVSVGNIVVACEARYIKHNKVEPASTFVPVTVSVGHE